MKILAPINKVNEIEKIIQAGARELYCGMIEEDWLKKHANCERLNKEPSVLTSLQNFEELKQSVSIAHSLGVPLYLTVNAIYFTEEEYPYLKDYIKRADAAGVDAFIISDLGLLLLLKEIDVRARVHMSKVGVVYNHEAALFYRNLGVDRIVLPEHQTITEITQLTGWLKKLSLEVEIFILNGGCKYTEGFCTFLHRTGKPSQNKQFSKNIISWLYGSDQFFQLFRRIPENIVSLIENCDFCSALMPSVCMKHGRSVVVESSKKGGKSVKRDNKKFCSNFLSQKNLCAACNIYDFSRLGVDSFKIMGRGYRTEKKVKDVKFIYNVINFLKDGNGPKEEFSSRVKAEYRKIYGVGCNNNCYYLN